MNTRLAVRLAIMMARDRAKAKPRLHAPRWDETPNPRAKLERALCGFYVARAEVAPHVDLATCPRCKAELERSEKLAASWGI